MDKNQIIGFSLLTVMLIVYMYFNTNEQKKLEAQKKATADSIALEQQHIHDSIALLHSASNSSTDSTTKTSRLSMDSLVKSQPVTFQNNLFNITFNSQGGYPETVILKKYQTYSEKYDHVDDDSALVFMNGPQNILDFTLMFPEQIVHTKNLVFTPETNANGVTFSALAAGHPIQFVYTFKPDNYMIDFHIKTDGTLSPSQKIEGQWITKPLHTEQDLKNERTNTQFYYRDKTEEEVDYYTIKEEVVEDFEMPVDWMSVKQQFFNSTLIYPQGFQNLKSSSKYSLQDSTNIVTMNNQFTLAPSSQTNDIALQWYIGPNSYQTLKGYKMDLQEIIPMGRGIFEFVKYINRGLILPIFNFLSRYISNYGIIIMILTLIIRLGLSFFTYKSYLSQAKMKALKPELDELRAKYKDNQQAMGTEQMKLYQQAGVNPLGGCIPSLLQLPFLLAMYSFFPSSIELRQKSFLWAHDLSTYDSIYSWTTHIPLISNLYGNHISLFTILLTITSLMLALYNSSMTDTQNNPALKYMPYIMPIMFLGFFNNMASGLTFYYFFSNVISLTQQWFIKNYVINHDKIRVQIDENKKKPASESKFAKKMAELQQQNEERRKALSGKK